LDTRNAITMVFLAAAAVGSWQLGRSPIEGEVQEPASEGPALGFYLKSPRILGTNKDGTLLYKIEAQYAKQLANNDIELQEVNLRYSAKTNVPWMIKANVAIISQDQKLLNLQGDVVATSNEGFSGQITEIRTAQLEIEPGIYKAETNNRVYLRIGPRRLTGTGMLALLRENRLELKSNVSGQFVP